jgi:hypothetical protein
MGHAQVRRIDVSEVAADLEGELAVCIGPDGKERT